MDRVDLLATWQESAAAVLELCAPLTPEQWSAPTPCPGWSVADVVAHLVDLESMGAGDPRPEVDVDVAALPHVQNPIGAVIEVGVESRRGLSGAQLLQEYRTVMMRRAAQLDGVTGEVPSLFGGQIPVEQALGMRILDTWVHEQDIRSAIDQPGGMTSAAAQVTGQLLLRGLPVAWGKRVAPPVGAVLRVTVTGPGVVSDQILRIDDDGRARVLEGPAAEDPAAAPAVHLTMSWPDYLLAATGRVDTGDPSWRASVTLTGSADLVDRTLVALNAVP